MAKTFDLYGHRGARGLEPENTIPAYAKALEIGVDAVDMDVVMTKDHVVVVYHNLALNPDITKDENGAWITNAKHISQMTFEELQKYDVGQIKPGTPYASYFPEQHAEIGTRIPSLKEVIQFVKQHPRGGDQIKFQIEIKNHPDVPLDYSANDMAKAVADIIQEENIVNRVEVQAFNWPCLYELQHINPNIPTAYLTDTASEIFMRDPNPAVAGKWTGGKLVKDYGDSTVNMIKSLGGKLWDPQDIELTKEKVEEAHAQGLRVVTWSTPGTSGKDIDMAVTEAVIDMGVDGVITDRPDKVAAIQHKLSI